MTFRNTFGLKAAYRVKVEDRPARGGLHLPDGVNSSQSKWEEPAEQTHVYQDHARLSYPICPEDTEQTTIELKN